MESAENGARLLVYGKTIDEWHRSTHQTYGWHTGTCEWRMVDIRMHASDIRLTYKYMRVTYGRHTSDIWMTYKYIPVAYRWHASDIRMAYEHIRDTSPIIAVSQCVMSYGSAYKALPSLHFFCNSCCTTHPHIPNESKGCANSPHKPRKEEKHLSVKNLVLQLYKIIICLYRLFIVS